MEVLCAEFVSLAEPFAFWMTEVAWIKLKQTWPKNLLIWLYNINKMDCFQNQSSDHFLVKVRVPSEKYYILYLQLKWHKESGINKENAAESNISLKTFERFCFLNNFFFVIRTLFIISTLFLKKRWYNSLKQFLNIFVSFSDNKDDFYLKDWFSGLAS